MEVKVDGEEKEYFLKVREMDDISSLESWDAIPSLMNASGVGYYTTSFSWLPELGRDAVTDPSLPHLAHTAPNAACCTTN